MLFEVFISRYICFQSNLTKVVMYHEWNSKLKTNKKLMEKKFNLERKVLDIICHKLLTYITIPFTLND